MSQRAQGHSKKSMEIEKEIGNEREEGTSVNITCLLVMGKEESYTKKNQNLKCNRPRGQRFRI
jgi:hypothetical protein